jgi:hypothetical protein
MKYRLHVPEGYYEADSLIQLLFEVFKHRFHHWKNGEGWRD